MCIQQWVWGSCSMALSSRPLAMTRLSKFTLAKVSSIPPEFRIEFFGISARTMGCVL
jgi:hypothetical protein